MQIQVKLGEPLWRAVGRHRLALTWPDDAAVTVAGVLARLAAAYPGFAEAYAGAGLVQAHPYRVFVDAVLVAAPRLEPGTGSEAGSLLRDGQTVFILLPAAGG